MTPFVLRLRSMFSRKKDKSCMEHSFSIFLFIIIYNHSTFSFVIDNQIILKRNKICIHHDVAASLDSSVLFNNQLDLDDDEDVTFYEKFPSRHPIFDSTNVKNVPMPMPKELSILWEKILPESSKLRPSFDLSKIFHMGKVKTKNPERQRIGLDINVEFHNPQEGASKLIENSLMEKGLVYDDVFTMYEKEKVIEYLSNILSSYQKVASRSECKEQLCKARMVVSNGPTGQRCPRWHLDHVPVRLVMVRTLLSHLQYF